MVLDAVDQDMPARPTMYFSFSKREPRLYSLTNGFPGKSLGQLTSGWGKGKEWARELSMHISAPTQSSCNHVLFTSLPVTAWKAWACVISLTQLLHPLAYKENLRERNTCSQMKGGYRLFLTKNKNSVNGKNHTEWCWKADMANKEILFLVLALLHKATWPLLRELKNFMSSDGLEYGLCLTLLPKNAASALKN